MRTLPTRILTAATVTALVAVTYAGAAAQDAEEGDAVIAFDAASATISVDGDTTDWSGIEGATATLEQLRLDTYDPTQAAEIEFGPLDAIEASLKVANDDSNIYVLFEVPDDFDYDPEDHNLSASIAVMFRVDDPAPPHMGAEEADLSRSLGLVDIWHWELDCGPGEVSGGQGIAGGDDPACNFDDEYSTKPVVREDDGLGDVENPDAENGLTGVWSHTAQEAGADGTWIFEMSRPLQNGDPQDAQFAPGETALIALAYFDADETPDGWTDAGHLQSAYHDWIEVTLQ